MRRQRLTHSEPYTYSNACPHCNQHPGTTHTDQDNDTTTYLDQNHAYAYTVPHGRS